MKLDLVIPVGAGSPFSYRKFIYPICPLGWVATCTSFILLLNWWWFHFTELYFLTPVSRSLGYFTNAFLLFYLPSGAGYLRNWESVISDLCLSCFIFLLRCVFMPYYCFYVLFGSVYSLLCFIRASFRRTPSLNLNAVISLSFSSICRFRSWH